MAWWQRLKHIAASVEIICVFTQPNKNKSPISVYLVWITIANLKKLRWVFCYLSIDIFSRIKLKQQYDNIVTQPQNSYY